jgi:hypothetical protein
MLLSLFSEFNIFYEKRKKDQPEALCVGAPPLVYKEFNLV